MLDNLASNFLLPQVLFITYSKILIDNIFCKIPSSLTNIISANLSSRFSDHLPQILILPNIYPSIQNKCAKNLIRDWSNFDNEGFVQDFLNINWTNIIKPENGNVDMSLNNFLDNIDIKNINNHINSNDFINII